MARDQLQVLNVLDIAKTQLYHFTAIVIAGLGFFTDAYDLFCISLVTKLLGSIYYQVDGYPKPGILPPNVSAAVNGVAFCGTLTGRLFFGWLGDKMGRKRVYGMTLMVMVICSVGSGLSFSSSPKSIIATLCFFRFWLGFGIGGDYPLSATIMSEYANKKTHGAFIAAVFAMQGFGILAGGMVAIIVSAAFKAKYDVPPYSVDPIGSTVPQADYVWRIIVIFGAIPASLTYYWRMKMPETARYTALIAKNAKQAAADMSKVLQVEIEPENEKIESLARASSNSFGLFSREFARRHGLHLLGTTTTWFLLDIAFYSQNLFRKDIFSAIGWIPKPQTMNAIEEVFKIARAQTLIALCGTVPGYWFTVALIDYIGRFFIQAMGFFMMTVFMLALAISYHHWTLNHIPFVIIYGLTFFFANFGPNSTTFIVPAEIFPARLRSTCHGISAAAGKAGAIVGAFGFLYASQNKDRSLTDAEYPPGIGVRNTLFVLSACNFLGLLFTFLVPESNGKSLEELSRENEDDSEHGTKSCSEPHSSNGREKRKACANLPDDPGYSPPRRKKRATGLADRGRGGRGANKVLHDAETRYQRVEKLVYALVMAARKLRLYFQAHTIKVLTGQPLRQILHRPETSGRLVEWAVELSEFDIKYLPRPAIKAQVLADFIAECTMPDSDPGSEAAPPLEAEPVIPEQQIEAEAVPLPALESAAPPTSPLPCSEEPLWEVYVDGSSNKSGSGAGLVLTGPEDFVLNYALRSKEYMRPVKSE
ncbi:inorganic phosphate transporter 1-4-like [Tasmannia lanceolata]|uniref:inorganic phosphate transporter 1-4-like n=1 Tax=Tasmannia lanceolata TaxID=3420 RepID=UPI00406375C2